MGMTFTNTVHSAQRRKKHVQDKVSQLVVSMLALYKIAYIF